MKTDETNFTPVAGNVYDIPNEAYHASIGVSSSGLKLFNRSPLHYFDKYLAADREPQKSTPSLILGTQIHTAILEPERYFATYYPLPEKYDLRTKAGKADFEYHESKAAAEGKELISAENHLICQKIAEAIHESFAASYFFDNPGVVEHSFYWTDPITGVLCKCRPDKLLEGLPIIVDLKSTQDASEDSFCRDVFNYGYHISAEFYRRGVEEVTGRRINSFVFAAFETTRPYACSFFQADETMLDYAGKEIDRILARFAECQASNDWPGYGDQVVPISLPHWVKTA